MVWFFKPKASSDDTQEQPGSADQPSEDNQIAPAEKPVQYVDFLVIDNGQEHRIRTDKKRIINSKTTLASKVSSRITGITKHCTIRNVDRENFETFISYLETGSIEFKSLTHISEMLYFVKRFECRRLKRRCIESFNELLTVENVVGIYRFLMNSKVGNKRRTSLEPKVIPYRSQLIKCCLDKIELNADEVFRQEAILDLNWQQLRRIVEIDTLNISSEVVLLDLLARWSQMECIRKNLDPSSAENRRHVLDDLVHCPRYLNLSREEIRNARDHIELLAPAVSSLVGEILLSEKRQWFLSREQIHTISIYKRKRRNFRVREVEDRSEKIWAIFFGIIVVVLLFLAVQSNNGAKNHGVKNPYFAVEND